MTGSGGSGIKTPMQTRTSASPAIELSPVQVLRKRLLIWLTVACGLCFAVIGSQWLNDAVLRATITRVGVVLIIICIAGRTWCSLYISGRKDVFLVTVGPYSVCRNPLYTFSILGVAGIGAQLGSITVSLVVGMATWALFYLVAKGEEKMLLRVYGGPYADYCARVPRFGVRLSQWQSAGPLEVYVGRVVRTFVDACLFLLAIPAAAAFAYVHDAGLFPVFLRLP